MQLLMEHSQKGKVFSLWAKYELLAQDEKLVDEYNIRKFVLVEGDVRHDRERAMKLAIGLSLVVFLLGFAAFGQPVAGITFALIAFPVGWIVIYRHIRETVTVADILDGRHFACRSIVTLLQKKQQITEMAQKFTQFVKALRNWGGREVIEVAPDRPPSPSLWKGSMRLHQLNECLKLSLVGVFHRDDSPMASAQGGIPKPIGGALLFPYVLYREIKEQIDLWKTKGHTPLSGKRGEQKELKTLVDRAARYRAEAPLRREKLARGSLQTSLLTGSRLRLWPH